MGIFFAILDAFLLGTANFLLKKSYKDFSPSIAFFIFSVFTVLIWVPTGIFLGIDTKNILFGSFVGIVSAVLGQAIYVYMLSKGELSITATILSTYSVYTIFFSVIFNNERPSLLTIFFISITIIGTIIISLPEKVDKNDLKKLRFIVLAIFTAVCIGISDTLTKFYITNTSVGSFLFYVAFSQLFVSLLYLRFDNQPISQFKDILHKLKEYKFALLGSFLISISTLCLFLSFNFTLASIASPISASYPIVTIFFALVFLKEKISFKNWIGLLFVLISVIVIGALNP